MFTDIVDYFMAPYIPITKKCVEKSFYALITGQCSSLLIGMVLSDTAMVISSTVPALEGQNITFSCFGSELWLSL